MEECLISVLLAIARHSPMGVNAIMKCQRLVQTVVHRFTANSNMDVYPSKIKSVCLLKVSFYSFVFGIVRAMRLLDSLLC